MRGLGSWYGLKHMNFAVANRTGNGALLHPKSVPAMTSL